VVRTQSKCGDIPKAQLPARLPADQVCDIRTLPEADHACYITHTAIPKKG